MWFCIRLMGVCAAGVLRRRRWIRRSVLGMTEFLATDSIDAYFDKKRAFMLYLRLRCQSWELASFVALFTALAPSMSQVWEPMIERRDHFRSFGMFLEEFETVKYPNMAVYGHAKFQDAFQQPQESVREYWVNFKKWGTLAGVVPEEHLIQFLTGVADVSLRQNLREDWAKGAAITELLEKARYYETGMELEQSLNAPAKQQVQVASAAISGEEASRTSRSPSPSSQSSSSSSSSSASLSESSEPSPQS